MERRKRSLSPSTVYDDNNHKKQKVQNEFITNKSRFENLVNETIYEIFDYLDVYHVYQAFFYINQRFENLIINSNFPIQINVSTISKSNLDLYHKNMIKPNKHRINYLRLSNPFSADIILSPPRIICDFIQLETLIFDNIDAKYLHNIFKHLISLPKLHSLVLSFADYVPNPSIIFSSIFSLPKLKSCKLTYRTEYDQQPMPIYLTDLTSSSIEYFVINNRFSIDSLCDIFLRLPQLRYLSADCSVGSSFTYIDEDPIALEYLKYVSIELDNIRFDVFEELVKSFFSCVEVLHVTTHDSTYLILHRWEELILSSMPNLRIFDIHHTSNVQNDQLIYLLLICELNSSFWIQRQWFLTYEHNGLGKSDNLILYSTNPYRRKDYKLHWEFERKLNLRTQENNFNSVKHVHLCSKYALKNSLNYFPNANELTIEYYFKTFNDSILTILNQTLPLKQLNKLVINSSSFPFEQIVKLIHSTPNLQTSKLNLLSFDGTNSKLIEQSETFQNVSNTNKIKILELREPCTLENIQMIMKLFPQVEYLKTGMNRKVFHQIIRFLFSKTNNKIHQLLFLCISHLPKVCLEELKVLIKIENLLKDYSIKYINRDLYLWW